jgi:hypothetical protein
MYVQSNTGAIIGTDRSGTAPHVPLIMVTASLEAARIDTSQNMMVGTTATTGSVDNVAKLVAGVHSSISGSITAVTNTPITIFTIPSHGISVWLVSVGLIAGDTANYATTQIISTQGSSVTRTTLVNGALLSITNSGLAIQVTQISGTTTTVYYSAMRIMTV